MKNRDLNRAPRAFLTKRTVLGAVALFAVFAGCAQDGAVGQGGRGDPGASAASRAAPQGYIPSAAVARPTAPAWNPPPVVEAPNPIANRPPMQATNGVNGTRPPRPVSGLSPQ